jgi:hypothetical protein
MTETDDSPHGNRVTLGLTVGTVKQGTGFSLGAEASREPETAIRLAANGCS